MLYHEWINNPTFIALINELHAGKSPESMSSSLIDRLVGAQYRCTARATLDVCTGCSHAKKTGWRTLARRSLCECVRKGFPTAPRPRPHRCLSPVADLLRRYRSYAAPHSYQTWYACSAPRHATPNRIASTQRFGRGRAHAHHNITFEHLIIMAQHSWNCCIPRLILSTSIIYLIYFIIRRYRTKTFEPFDL